MITTLTQSNPKIRDAIADLSRGRGGWMFENSADIQILS